MQSVSVFVRWFILRNMNFLILDNAHSGKRIILQENSKWEQVDIDFSPFANIISAVWPTLRWLSWGFFNNCFINGFVFVLFFCANNKQTTILKRYYINHHRFYLWMCTIQKQKKGFWRIQDLIYIYKNKLHISGSKNLTT